MKAQTRSRRLALQGLCCLDMQGRRVMDLIDEFLDDANEPPEVISAARALMRGVWDEVEQYDGLLKRHARNWELTRLALVDRNILRLSCHEILQGLAPYKVVISEAIHMAREFSTAESPRFVNGVLDAIAREIRDEIDPATP